MYTFLLIVQTLIAAAMVAVILMQRSEGGGLGVGGSPSGLMSARGAADFLTRATSILATLFVTLSIVLAGLATLQRGPIKVDPAAGRAPSTTSSPLAPAGRPGGSPFAPPPASAPAKAPPPKGQVPLAQ
jgi:preprotein translocase subunit SecG